MNEESQDLNLHINMQNKINFKIYKRDKVNSGTAHKLEQPDSIIKKDKNTNIHKEDIITSEIHNNSEHINSNIHNENKIASSIHKNIQNDSVFDKKEFIPKIKSTKSGKNVTRKPYQFFRVM